MNAKFMKFIKCRVWGVLSAVLTTLFVILLVVNTVANRYALQLNDFLGIEKQQLQNEDHTNDYDRDYGPDELDALKNYTHSVAKQLVEEGAVLLKNDIVDGQPALPLAAGTQVNCFLQGSVKFNYSATGSSASSSAGYASLKDALTADGLSVNQTLWSFYDTGAASGYRRNTFGNDYNVNEAPWRIYTQDVINSLSGVALFTIARDSGEGKDVSVSWSDGVASKDYLSLTADEIEVLRQVTELKKSGKVSKIIVLLNSSAGIQLDFLDDDKIDVDACLWVGNVGCEGIHAVADLLVAKNGISPSGKLSDTFLKDNFSSPAMRVLGTVDPDDENSFLSFTSQYTNASQYNLNESQSNYVVYSEGIYVGYRYYETRYEDYVTGRPNAGTYDYYSDVAYPFGYGKTYSEFEYGDISVTPSADGKTFEVKVFVTNTGDVTAKEAVQVYLQKPYTDYDVQNGVEKASAELVAFDKKEIEAGKTEQYVMTVDKSLFKSYDANGAGTYILDKGNYYLTVAANAHEAINNILAKKGHTPQNTSNRMDSEGNAGAVYVWENGALDETTYSVSEYTGKKISNLFDFADVNRYEGSGSNSVTYVSRNNWAGTMPTAPVRLSIATSKMAHDISSNKSVPSSSGKKPAYGKSSDITLAQLRGLSYYGEDSKDKWDALLDKMTWEEQAELVSSGYFTTIANGNIMKPATTEADGPVGVSSGASATGTVFPCEGIWAATFDIELIQKTGDAFAEDAVASGKTGIYASGVNIHRTPFGGRSAEYFSEDPYLTAMASKYEIIGLQKKGVVAHVKHLAFNEQETNRAGLCVWLNEQSAREIYLLPFEYSLSESHGGAGAVMSAFGRVGCIWSGASSNLLIDLIHGEWDFYGYCITDMASSNGAQFMTYQDGLPNGTDLYLQSGSESAFDDFKNNTTVANRLREATHRILYTVVNKSVAMNGVGPDTVIIVPTPWWEILLIVLLSVIGVFAAACSGLYLFNFISGKIKKK